MQAEGASRMIFYRHIRYSDICVLGKRAIKCMKKAYALKIGENEIHNNLKALQQNFHLAIRHAKICKP